jgi:hypothetical protein
VTDQAKRLPDFIAVGPPRTATTWLDQELRGHVGLPAQAKETHFFARNYCCGLDWYESHFRHCATAPVVGEICASYFENGSARERICAHIPRSKIICTLREPVDRLYSYYKLMRQKGKTNVSFEQALTKHQQMLECSRYAFHIRQWQMQFGSENVLGMLNDDLVSDSQGYLDQIARFIGIPKIMLESASAPSNRANSIDSAPLSAWLAYTARKFRFWLGSHQFYRTRRILKRAGVWRFCFSSGEEFPPLDHAMKSRLRGILRSEVEVLEELLRRDLSGWKEGYEPERPSLLREAPQTRLPGSL